MTKRRKKAMGHVTEGGCHMTKRRKKAMGHVREEAVT